MASSEFSVWASQLVTLGEGERERMQEVWDREDTTDWEGFTHAETHSTVVRTLVQGDDTNTGKLKGKIYFEDGGVFEGKFSLDLSIRTGKLYRDERSSLYQSGTWINGLLEGRVLTTTVWGGLEVCHYKRGVRHGYYVDLGPHVHFPGVRPDTLRRFLLYVKGEAAGLAYRGTMGGGFMVGQQEQGNICDRNAVVVLPGHKTAYKGVVHQDKFYRGTQHHVLGVANIQNGVLQPLLSPPLSTEIHRRDSNMWTAPLMCEPWEHERVQARTSDMSGAGEGLFARRALKKGELVALMNGKKSPPCLDQEWSDYRINLNGDTDIDIPEDMRSVTQYCATLAHKANHSFTPNCRWGRVDHPRFGLIISLVALRDCAPGEEVTVNYRLPLHLAPVWYKDCYRAHTQAQAACDRRLGQ